MPTFLIDKIFPFRRLPKSVYVLFTAWVINRAGDFVRYFLTLYLVRILGMSTAAAGIVVTLSIAATITGALLSGHLIDSLGRKKVLLAAQFIGASIMAAAGFFPDSPKLPILLVMTQLFFGVLRPAAQALITDITPYADRRRAYGLVYFGINIGTALGPLIAGILFNTWRQWLFWGDAATTLISGLLIMVFVHEPEKEHVQRGGELEDHDKSGTIRALLARPMLTIYFGIAVITHFIYGQTFFALPLLMDQLFNTNGPQFFGLLIMVNAITVLLFTSMALVWAERKQPIPNMAVGTLCYALGFGCLAIVPASLGWILASTVVWTWGEILLATNTGIFCAAHTPVNHRGRFSSVEHFVAGLGELIAPATAGYLTGFIGLRGFWVPILGLSLAAFFLFLVLGRMDRRGKKTS